MSDFIEVNTGDLCGPALDWAVANSEGVKIDDSRGKELRVNFICQGLQSPWIPSVNWHQGGPLIASHAIGFWGYDADNWQAVSSPEDNTYVGIGPTHLIAACRMIVTAKFGKTIKVPTELLK